MRIGCRPALSGKPARLLKTRWTEAWAAHGAPEPLPMRPVGDLISELVAEFDDILGRLDKFR